jgi:uncharacterized heparinase superfamily protein
MRFEQLAGRLRRRLSRARPELGAAPARRALTSRFVEPCKPAAALDERGFRALGVSHAIDAPGIWNDRSHAALWLYNLHYFDDLNAHDAQSRTALHQSLLRRWIRENPPAVGIGWEPYPVARRLVNWIKWRLRGMDVDAPLDHSLAVQARWMARKLEYHLGGNHLLADAKALCFVGWYFTGPEAEAWRTLGTRLLERELAEQVLTDGGHYERSPMYHAATLEDLLDVLNLLATYGKPAPPAWLDTAARMARWLDALTQPDGEPAFFNDTACGIAPTRDDLADYAARLSLPRVAGAADFSIMPDSGYVRVRRAGAWIACDCAPLGPDYLPAPGHADTLSFEFSLGGRRVLVSSGTSLYGESMVRVRQRGTAAHNTVVVDGQDSSEVWSGFRVARRAHVFGFEARDSRESALIAASHDGYRRLPGRNLHRRRWQLEDQVLLIEDRVEGRFQSAAAHWHFHPRVRVSPAGRDAFTLEVEGGATLRLEFEGAREVCCVPGSWHPRFGESLANSKAVVTLDGGRLSTRLTWS